MPLQTSGQISLNDLQAEFGGTHPASMSEYRGKDCTDITGPISFSDFYGKDDYVTPDSNDFQVGGSSVSSNFNPTAGILARKYNFTVPCGVFIVHIVCVGGGGSGGEAFYSGGGGGGGSLTYVNDVDVTPGMVLEVWIGNGGATGGTRSNGNPGWSSYVKKNGTTIALANGGSAGLGGSSNTTRDFMGGAGGTAWNGSSAMTFAGTNATYASYDGGYGGQADDDDAGGGGGAAGYAGRGGHGRSRNTAWTSLYPSPNPPSGSGGGSGSYTWSVNYLTNDSTARATGDRGGGVGLFGKGSDGNTWSSGGSGGADGLGSGLGNYGGGGSGAGLDQPGQTVSPEGLQPSDCGGQTGAPGAVRIMWGTGKSFPNNAS